MNTTWQSLVDAFGAGDPLLFAGLAFAAGLAAYGLVRRLMRVGWLRLAMRIGYFGGVAALVTGAALALTYYHVEAWLPVLGGATAELFASPLSWIAAAVVIAAGLALRRPVPRTVGGVRLSDPRPAADPPRQDDDAPEPGNGDTNVIRGPWRDAA